MWSDQAYYYSDSSFQLELNLQAVRRSLIQMLDDFEASDCTRCKLIKCRCEPNGPTPPQSLTGSTPSLTDPWGPGPGVGARGANEPISPKSFAEAVGGQADQLTSPAAMYVPRPSFKSSSGSNEPLQPIKDVESWVRASTPNPDKTVSPGSKPFTHTPWPPTRTVWNEYKDKISRPEINMATVSQAGNVQDFFRSFNVNIYTVGDKTFAQNRAMMQKLKDMANKPLEYTYF